MPSVLSHFLQQSFCLPKPPLTEENLPDQSGRVFIVTGGYAGVGLELCDILYGKNGIVHIAGRNSDKAAAAIARLRHNHPSSAGTLSFLELDLSDLHSIPPAINVFLARSPRLDVLVNNAGVMFPPVAEKSAQGYDLQLATNCVGPYLLTALLLPLLTATATALSTEPGSVRVLWAASFGVDALSPNGGVTFNDAGDVQPDLKSTQTNYGMSKAGNLFLATEYGRRRNRDNGADVLHLAFNPGNLKTELQRHSGGFGLWAVEKALLFPARFGAYTELWAGWATELGGADQGSYVWPWGRKGGVRRDVLAELGPGGNADRFWEWCERTTREFR